MTLFEIVVICFLQLFFLPILVHKLRSRTLSLFDFIFLSLLDVGLSYFLIYPQTFSYLSAFFGIGRGVDVFVYFGLITLFYIVFRIYFKMEKMKQEITRLNRELSLKNVKDK